MEMVIKLKESLLGMWESLHAVWSPEFNSGALILAIFLLILALFYLARISRNLNILASVEEKHTEERDLHFANLEPQIKAGISNILHLEMERLKSGLKQKISELRNSASGGGADSESKPAYLAEFEQSFTRRADEHRLAMEERMENIAELVKQNAAPVQQNAAPVQQPTPPAGGSSGGLSLPGAAPAANPAPAAAASPAVATASPSRPRSRRPRFSCRRQSSRGERNGKIIVVFA